MRSRSALSAGVETCLQILANPDLALAKAELVQRIRDLIGQRKLTQMQAATLLGLDQPKVSALVRGRVEGYSIDRLFRFLNALGQRVEIIVRPNEEDSETRAVVVTSWSEEKMTVRQSPPKH